MKKDKKKPTRRSAAKFPALQPQLNLKRRYELIDYDYLDKLSDKEKKWLNDFTEEWVNAKTKDARFHKSKKARKLCHDRNNASNRCIWTLAKASGKNANLDTLEPDEAIAEEDKLIEELDKKYQNKGD